MGLFSVPFAEDDDDSDDSKEPRAGKEEAVPGDFRREEECRDLSSKM